MNFSINIKCKFTDFYRNYNQIDWCFNKMQYLCVVKNVERFDCLQPH